MCFCNKSKGCKGAAKNGGRCSESDGGACQNTRNPEDMHQNSTDTLYCAVRRLPDTARQTVRFFAQ